MGELVLATGSLTPTALPMKRFFRSRHRHLRRSRRTALLVLSLAVAIAGVGVFLLPSQLGGRATFVVTDGTSMQPGISTGDLVIAREASSYAVGDVVAFHSHELDTTVLHRIVDRDADGFITQGDNNDWLDPERPTEEQILGRMWVKIPAGGKILSALGSPAGTAGMSTFALVGSGFGINATTRRRRRRRKPKPAHIAKKKRFSTLRNPFTVSQRRQAAAVTAVVAVAATGAAAFTSFMPAERTVRTDVPFTHDGAFSYEAPVPGSSVYYDGSVDTGETVFLKLVDEIDVNFQYNFDGEPEAIAGTIELDALLEGASGWTRTFPLVEPQDFIGVEVDIDAELSLAHMIAVAERIDEETGAGAGARTLTLRPSVAVAQGEDLPPFEPEVAFRLDQHSLRPTTAPSAGSPDGAMAVTETGSLSNEHQSANHIVVLGRNIPVEGARNVAAGVGAVATILAIVLFVGTRRSRLSELERMMARYPGRIVTAEHIDPASLPVADMAEMADLIRVAEREDRLVVHVAGDGAYFVHGDTAVYRFRANSAMPTPRRLHLAG